MTFMDTGEPGMFNRYSYTMNDPINETDPTGMEVVCNRDRNGGGNCSDSVRGYSTNLPSMTDADFARFNSYIETGDISQTYTDNFPGLNTIANSKGGNGFQSGNPGDGGRGIHIQMKVGWISDMSEPLWQTVQVEMNLAERRNGSKKEQGLMGLLRITYLTQLEKDHLPL